MACLVPHCQNIRIGSQHIGNASILQRIELVPIGKVQVLAQLTPPIIPEAFFTLTLGSWGKVITE